MIDELLVRIQWITINWSVSNRFNLVGGGGRRTSEIRRRATPCLPPATYAGGSAAAARTLQLAAIAAKPLTKFHSPKLNSQLKRNATLREITQYAQELRAGFDKDKEQHPSGAKLLLSVAVPAGQDNIDNGFDVQTISE